MEAEDPRVSPSTVKDQLDQYCTVSTEFKSLLAAIVISFSYVVSLYIHPFGPRLIAFPVRSRDDPAEVRSRFLRVFLASIVSSAVCISFQLAEGSCAITPCDAAYFLSNMGFRVSGLLNAAVIPLFLTIVLFVGPITGDYFLGRWNGYNRAFLTLLYRNLYYRRRILRDSLQSLLWWRAFVVAPVSEEFVYRACLVPVILPCYGKAAAIFLSPLSFGVAHLHHIIDKVRLGVSVKNALLTGLFQVSYTSIFGFYSAYLFVRTGHIVAPIVVHTFCNLLGVPDLNGTIRHLSNTQKFVVGLVYVLGLILWIVLLGPLTSPTLYETS